VASVAGRPLRRSDACLFIVRLLSQFKGVQPTDVGKKSALRIEKQVEESRRDERAAIAAAAAAEFSAARKRAMLFVARK
jgi:hypothetical protein